MLCLQHCPTMPLNDERPTSTSAAASEDQGSDGESMLSRCDSTNSASDLDYSRQSFTSDCSSKQSSPSCECTTSYIAKPFVANKTILHNHKSYPPHAIKVSHLKGVSFLHCSACMRKRVFWRAYCLAKSVLLLFSNWYFFKCLITLN